MDKIRRKPVTMNDIAREVGVSKNAVSLALSHKPGVSESMRLKILDAAKKLDYKLSPTPDTEKSCLVVVVPDYIRNDGFFYSEIFWAIEHEARKLGYLTLTVGLSRRDEENIVLPDVPDDLEAIGYLAIGIIKKEYLDKFALIGKRVVCIDISNSAVPISSITNDNLYGGWMATDYLIRCGHKKIGFVGPMFSAQSVYERWCGYRKAMLDNSLTVNEEMCILGKRDEFELLDSEKTVSKYLEPIKEMPTAWFCAGDLIAVSMMKNLTAMGYRVPEDISIMGFDDLKIAELVSPPMTTIHVDRKLMGKLAVHQLLNENQQRPEPIPVRVSIPCSLVERKSIKQLK